VYSVATTEGGAECLMKFYKMDKKYEHVFEQSAFNLCYGPSGVTGILPNRIGLNHPDKDTICVQSLDGLLTVYEQDRRVVSRWISNHLIPGPITYVPSIDSFLIASSQLHIDCFKYKSVAVGLQGDNKIKVT
jgi:Bardet-Biedl syndrome 9 protein